MAVLKLRVQPGWQPNTLTMQFWQDKGSGLEMTAAGATNGAALSVENGTNIVTQTVELNPADAGNSTVAGPGIIQCISADQDLVAQGEAEIDANGNLLLAPGPSKNLKKDEQVYLNLSDAAGGSKTRTGFTWTDN